MADTTGYTFIIAKCKWSIYFQGIMLMYEEKIYKKLFTKSHLQFFIIK